MYRKVLKSEIAGSRGGNPTCVSAEDESNGLAPGGGRGVTATRNFRGVPTRPEEGSGPGPRGEDGEEVTLEDPSEVGLQGFLDSGE